MYVDGIMDPPTLIGEAQFHRLALPYGLLYLTYDSVTNRVVDDKGKNIVDPALLMGRPCYNLIKEGSLQKIFVINHQMEKLISIQRIDTDVMGGTT